MVNEIPDVLRQVGNEPGGKKIEQNKKAGDVGDDEAVNVHCDGGLGTALTSAVTKSNNFFWYFLRTDPVWQEVQGWPRADSSACMSERSLAPSGKEKETTSGAINSAHLELNNFVTSAFVCFFAMVTIVLGLSGCCSMVIL